MNKIFFILQLILLLALLSCISNRNKKEKISIENLKTNNCIQDSISAVKFAKLKWEEKFGKEIYERGPFTAKMMNDSIWFVVSSYELNRNARPKTLNFGGVLSIQIRKSDCKVLFINVTK
ncbi:unnamed protein product [Phaeothamnion confervicola]